MSFAIVTVSAPVGFVEDQIEKGIDMFEGLRPVSMEESFVVELGDVDVWLSLTSKKSRDSVTADASGSAATAANSSPK